MQEKNAGNWEGQHCGEEQRLVSELLLLKVNVNYSPDKHIVDASRLLNELRESYQARALKEREQVSAFISELSCAAVTSIWEQYKGGQI